MPQISSYASRPLVKILGVDTAGRVGLSTSAPAPLLNVVQGGAVNQTQLPIAGSKTRFKGRRLFRFGRLTPSEVRFTFHNWYIQASGVNPEIAGATAVPISKAAAVYNSVSVPVTYGGQRLFTIPAGATEFICDPLYPVDFGAIAFAPGVEIEFRILFDLASGQNAPAAAQTFRPGWSQTYRGAPADLPDDVDAVGAMAATGAPDVINIFMPNCVLGRFPTRFPSLLLIGDSIFDRQNDYSGLGDKGGGYVKRAANAAGLPFFSMAQGGRTAAHQTASSRCKQIYPRFTDTHIGLGTNDIAFGLDVATSIIPTLRTLWQDLRSAGMTTIIQSTIVPRVVDNLYKCTDLTQMTPYVTQAVGGVGYGPGEARDVLNSSALPAEVGNGVGPDAIFNFSAYCQDATTTWKWKLDTYSGLLTSAAAIGATSVSLDVSPPLWTSLVFEPGIANVDLGGQGGPYPQSVSGSGPYVAVTALTDAYSGSAVGGTPSKTHAATTPVKGTIGTDGTHPAASVHISAAADLRNLYRRLHAS